MPRPRKIQPSTPDPQVEMERQREAISRMVQGFAQVKEPLRIKMLRMYAFYDDDDIAYVWQKGAIVEDQQEIAMLQARGFTDYEVI